MSARIPCDDFPRERPRDKSRRGDENDACIDAHRDEPRRTRRPQHRLLVEALCAAIDGEAIRDGSIDARAATTVEREFGDATVREAFRALDFPPA